MVSGLDRAKLRRTVRFLTAPNKERLPYYAVRFHAEVPLAMAVALAYEDARQRAESLLAFDRARTLFFSNVSHEFRAR